MDFFSSYLVYFIYIYIYIYIYIIHKICQISAILFYLDWKTWNLALLQILVGVQVRSSKILLCMRISLICSLCSVEIVYSGINFPVFFFHNLLCAAGFLLCSLVEHSWLLVVFLFHWLTIENEKPLHFSRGTEGRDRLELEQNKSGFNKFFYNYC